MSFAWIVTDGKARRATPGEAWSADASIAWVHLDGMSEADLAWLGTLDLPQLAKDALTDKESRPRTDALDDGALINLRGLDGDCGENRDLLASIRLWVTRGRVVSTAFRPLLALPEVATALEAGKLRDPGDLIWALATKITDELDPDIAALGDRLDDAEEMLSGSNALQLRSEIAEVRREAIVYRRFLQPQRVALERLTTIDAPWLNDDDRQHLREAADTGARMAEELEAIRERSALMHEQLTDLRSEVLDTRSLILAIAAMIFLPLTFITGLFGMNVDGIPYAHHPYSFWVITFVCLLIAIVVTGYFIARRWSR